MQGDLCLPVTYLFAYNLAYPIYQGELIPFASSTSISTFIQFLGVSIMVLFPGVLFWRVL